MKTYNVCVVGCGLVGVKIVELLQKRKFPLKSLKVLTRRPRRILTDCGFIDTIVASDDEFKGVDFSFFAGTEGEKGASKTYGWKAVDMGSVVIDNGADFRLDPRAALVIPQVNPDAVCEGKTKFFACPNCSTAIAAMVIAPLHKKFVVRRFTATTFQAVSGAGNDGVRELEEQEVEHFHGRPLIPNSFPHPIQGNLIPCIGVLNHSSGETSEEEKMRDEMCRLLGGFFRVSTTCVRVPVLNGHSIVLNVEVACTASLRDARTTLSSAKGVKLVDNVVQNAYPTPLQASGNGDVLVGRVRMDQSIDCPVSGISLFCSGDNLLRGSALTAVEIAEEWIAHH